MDGSVIVRENSVSLSGKTISGDLIIADGVSRIDLTGVTVTGRIVLRGGESGVTFKDTKAGKGIIANTDIAVSGSVDNITVAQGSAITVNSGASVRFHQRQRRRRKDYRCRQGWNRKGERQ